MDQADVTKAVKAAGPLRKKPTGADKKNYTEVLSQKLSEVLCEALRKRGLKQVLAPTGADKQFMGGYGTKGVDVFLSDEKHGLLLSSGTKGILFSVKKNLKNRYRDMAMEALELHKRFPYAVCGHLLFLGATEARRSSRKFGTVIQEAVTLLSGISGRRLTDDPAELYEEMAILLIEPGDPATIEMAPPEVPPELQAVTYAERLVEKFNQRNPFF